MKKLLLEISNCTLCSAYLPLGPRPIVQVHSQAKIVLIGQAPGSKVHISGIPWSDASGNELRRWLGIPEEIFYDEKQLALMPMGFCYPGKGRAGDLPPRIECAPQWHDRVMNQLKNVQLTLLIGSYAQGYYLNDKAGSTLTDTVKNYTKYLPTFLPLPHPSPRNRIWQKKNVWFEQEVVPVLQKKVADILDLSY